MRIPKRIGFLLASTCGFLLFCSKAEDYYFNVFFRINISLFILVAVHALAFRRSIYSQATMLDGPSGAPLRAKLAAVRSLLPWISILCAGRSIGYVQAQAGVSSLHLS